MNNPRPVVDIREYRNKRALTGMTDTQLEDRIMLVRAHQEDGWANRHLQAAMLSVTFPNGFDPENHPEDNLTRLEVELASRKE